MFLSCNAAAKSAQKNLLKLEQDKKAKNRLAPPASRQKPSSSSSSPSVKSPSPANSQPSPAKKAIPTASIPPAPQVPAKKKHFLSFSTKKNKLQHPEQPQLSVAAFLSASDTSITSDPSSSQRTLSTTSSLPDVDSTKSTLAPSTASTAAQATTVANGVPVVEPPILVEGFAVLNDDLCEELIHELLASSDPCVVPLQTRPCKYKQTTWTTWLRERLENETNPYNKALRMQLLALPEKRLVQFAKNIAKSEKQQQGNSGDEGEEEEDQAVMLAIVKNPKNTKEDLAVIGEEESLPLEVRLAVFDVDRTFAQVQHRMAESKQMADSLLKSASLAKQSGLSPVPDMTRRAWHIQRIAQDETILLSLEKSRLALVAAAEQKALVDTFIGTSQAMENLRQGQTSSEVHQIVDGYQDILHDTNKVLDVMTSTWSNESFMVDESVLLKELEELSQMEHQSLSVVDPTSSRTETFSQDETQVIDLPDFPTCNPLSVESRAHQGGLLKTEKITATSHLDYSPRVREAVAI